jgi:hypothetical protein
MQEVTSQQFAPFQYGRTFQGGSAFLGRPQGRLLAKNLHSRSIVKNPTDASIVESFDVVCLAHCRLPVG